MAAAFEVYNDRGYRLAEEIYQECLEIELALRGMSFRAKAASYARSFGYGAYSVREVTVTTNEPQPGPPPRLRLQASANALAEALPVEAGKAVVTANVNGTVQMK